MTEVGDRVVCEQAVCMGKRHALRGRFEFAVQGPHVFIRAVMHTIIQYLIVVTSVRVISGLRDDGDRHCRAFSPRCGDYRWLNQGHTIRQQKCVERPRGRLETRCVNRRTIFIKKYIANYDPRDIPVYLFISKLTKTFHNVN